MVYNHHRQPVLIGYGLQCREVAVVCGVDAVARWATHFLERIHEDELQVGMRDDEVLDLLGEPILDGRCRVREVEAVVRLISEPPEPLLHSRIGVLKTEVEHCSLADGIVPEGLTHAYSQPHGKHHPRLADLGSACKYVRSHGQ